MMDLKTIHSALEQLAEEKGVSREKVMDTIEMALAAAYKKEYGKRGQIIRSSFNPETGDLSFSQVKIVVDESMIKSEEELAEEEASRASMEETEQQHASSPPEAGEEAGHKTSKRKRR